MQKRTHFVFPCDVDFMKKWLQQGNCNTLFDLSRKKRKHEANITYVQQQIGKLREFVTIDSAIFYTPNPLNVKPLNRITLGKHAGTWDDSTRYGRM